MNKDQVETMVHLHALETSVSLALALVLAKSDPSILKDLHTALTQEMSQVMPGLSLEVSELSTTITDRIFTNAGIMAKRLAGR